MTKAYVLIYDADNGSREDCNIFYSPIEVFADAETRAKRIAFIKANSEYDIGFRTNDLDLLEIHDFDIPENLLSYEDEDEDTDDNDAVTYALGDDHPFAASWRRDYQVVDEEDYDSANPADYYFHVYETKDPWDHRDNPQLVTYVNVTPIAYFDKEKEMYDQSVSVDFGDRFSETMECEYEFAGTPEEARAAMLALGVQENAEFSLLIQRYVDEYNG